MNKQIIHYKMTWVEIAILSLSSLYLIVLLPIIASIYMKLSSIFSVTTQTKTLIHTFTTSWLLFIVFIVIICSITIGIRIVLTYVTYRNYKVASDETSIYIYNGMSNKTDITIPRTIINGIIIDRPILWRPLHLVKIKLICVHKQTVHKHNKTDLFVPFIREQRGKQLIEEILPQYKVQYPSYSMPNEAYFTELIQPSYVLVIVTFLVMFFWPEYWFIPILYACFIIIKRIIKTKQQRYNLQGDIASIQTGVFSTKITMMKRENIDALHIDQSWLQRKLGLASITITTQANPVQVTILDHVAEDVASQFYNWYTLTARN